MRGYSYLKKAGQLGLVRRIKADLVDEVMPEITVTASQHVFGASLAQAELVIRQLLLQRHAGAAMNKAIFYSLGKKSASVVYPLPKAWQKVLAKHGVRVDGIKSSLAWTGMIVLYWGYGVLLVTKLAWNSLWATLHNKTAVKRRYAYLEGLTLGNLPQPGIDGHSHDICTWYARWNGRMDDLDAICHGVREGNLTLLDGVSVEYVGRPFELMRSIKSVAQFLSWGVKAMAIVAVDALRGRWWHALVFAEAVKAKAVQLCDPDVLAADYLFHYSGTIYRPMWTYEAEKNGARIVCYFYSTSEQVKLPEGYESQRYEWGAASWPNYLVWDDYQADLIFRDIDQNAAIKIAGPIWFSTSSLEPPELPRESIAVFDIQPHRKAAHFGTSTLADYHVYNPGLTIQFLEDIHTVFSECGVIMAFKRKREIGNRGEKKYVHFVRQLSQSKDVVMIDPAISAIKVIERCKGVISMPFTSTALYMRDQGIPSVYYDPTSWIQKDDRGAHGTPILSGINELRDWVESISTFHKPASPTL
jgi:polysaccharide biosynthesis PFTS motif protein